MEGGRNVNGIEIESLDIEARLNRGGFRFGLVSVDHGVDWVTGEASTETDIIDGFEGEHIVVSVSGHGRWTTNNKDSRKC